MNQNLQSINYATIQDADDEQHIVCRFKDGQKYAAVIVDSDCDDLCHEICDFINKVAGYKRSELNVIVQNNEDAFIITVIGEAGLLIQSVTSSTRLKASLITDLTKCQTMSEAAYAIREHGVRISVNTTSYSV